MIYTIILKKGKNEAILETDDLSHVKEFKKRFKDFEVVAETTTGVKYKLEEKNESGEEKASSNAPEVKEKSRQKKERNKIRKIKRKR